MVWSFIVLSYITRIRYDQRVVTNIVVVTPNNNLEHRIILEIR
jgi:hypothetical protein